MEELVAGLRRSWSESDFSRLVALMTEAPERVDEGLAVFDGGQDASVLRKLQMLAYADMSSELSARAWRKLDEIARGRGVRVWELEGELVELCGLDEGLGLVVDGERLEVRLSPGLEPYWVCGEQRVVPESAAAGVILADLRDVLVLQMVRLELALSQEYRWRVDLWFRQMKDHPLMYRLASRLIWGCYSKYGRCLGTFRIDEEQELTGPDERRFEMPAECEIGILHPLHVDERVLGAWGQLLADYEVATLCQQVDRPVYGAPQGRDATLVYERDWSKIDQDAVALIRRGWFKGEPGWNRTTKYVRVFRVADIQVDLDIQTGGVGILDFKRFLGYSRGSLRLRDVPKVVLSEAQLDLALLSQA